MLTVAVSSRALFNLEDGNTIFQTEGWAAFDAYMRKNEKKPLRPGVAFPVIQKLLALNIEGAPRKVDVILLSSNTLDAGARVMNSVRHYGLNIDRAFFTSGGNRFSIAQAGNVTLFLSTNPDEVRRALDRGIASACVQPHSHVGESAPGIRIAFDGDSVLFDDSAERVNHESGLAAFTQNEQKQARIPLGAGPFKPVLQALQEIQESYADAADCPIRVALVTARSVSAYERVLHTFRTWRVKVDECFLCGGLPKGPFLAAFGADLFFDDGMHNIESAAQYVPSGHVPHGVANQEMAVTA
ncbi:5'-nucleotidase [Novimethylophilus kurashikiensis]|nr:5'-nucleotidase [Novimethylophilus kurashikiensis]